MYLQWWIKDLRGMSDLCLYELEDNVWDEFGESDDHIVPHPKQGDLSAMDSDGHKKPQRGVTGIKSNEKTNLPTVTSIGKMLEKGSWSQKPDGVFPSCDTNSVKDVTGISSDNNRMSSHSFKTGNVDSGGCDFRANDPIMGDESAAVDNNLYRYSLNQISETSNDLSFFDNDREDKENNDLLYYDGWADIGNFDDVDRMFRRSCDSTFGLESLNPDEEMCWFSSSHANEESEDASKSDLKFSESDAGSSKGLSDHQETLKENSVGSSLNGSNKKHASLSIKMSSQRTDADETAPLGPVSFVNGFDIKSKSRDILMPNNQTNLLRKQPNHQNQSEEKRTDQCLENGGSYHHYDNMKQFLDSKHPPGDISCQVYSTPGIQLQRSAGPNSMSYMQTKVPYINMDYSHHPDQISLCPALSGFKSENDSQPSPSLKESSHASNQAQSMVVSHDPSTETPVGTLSEQTENVYSCQGFPSSFSRDIKNAATKNPMAPLHGKMSVQKQMQRSESQIDGYSKGVSIEIPTELDSSNIQESSCMSSVLDDISLEATSFRQLQEVMGQLDVRTKLCIRDSLYRLARSAEQRHNGADQRGGIRESRDASGLLINQETNKCTDFMDIETDTNPIDRSIAHLLFHRPSDPSVVSANDSLSLRSHASIHESVSSPPLMAEKQIGEEETTIVAEKQLLLCDER
ncbi:hypothetical protein UlMin_032653 [Ulmus minor]